jgi:hypothetical protein
MKLTSATASRLRVPHPQVWRTPVPRGISRTQVYTGGEGWRLNLLLDSGRRADGSFPAARIVGGNMSNLVKALLGLSALAFVLAVVTHFAGPIVGTFGGTAGAGRSL